ncbi:MAG: histidine kinase [Rhodospirillum sp.]|nr:histidine kinase [Rhodospirillum sp.]MCF8487892.1 histidine kinase [Rhodospirillum sp.]MCF8501444.1 histidine kinase [Rhodospirillum sp.]
MDRQTPSFGRLIGVAALVCAPATGVFLILVLWGEANPAFALPATGVVIALTALLIRSFLADLALVVRRIRIMGSESIEDNGRESGDPQPRLEVAQRILAAVHSLDRTWRKRHKILRDQVWSDGQVLNNLPDPLLMMGADAIVTRANESARVLFSREPAGQEITTFLRDPNVLEAIESVLTSDQSRQVTWIMPGTVEREFEVRATRLPTKGVDGSLALLTLHDITALRRLEQMRADFVANASHELRTPLSSLIGFTETLAGSARDDPEARDAFLAIMLEQAQRMQRLIEDLLSLSRIEMEEHSPPSDPVDVAPVLESVAKFLGIKARDKSMEIRIEAASDLSPAIGDGDQLSQIFQNLVDNAIKYGRTGTSVLIRVASCDRGPPAMPAALRSPCLKISVRDQGDGIGKEHLPRLTERFYRVDKARSRALGGTGLGLAIVKHVVARHRGALTIESKQGEGTTFNVFLPFHAAGRAGAANAAE